MSHQPWSFKKTEIDTKSDEGDQLIPITEDLLSSIDMGNKQEGDAASNRKTRLFGVPLEAEKVIDLMKDLIIHLKKAGLDLAKLPIENLDKHNPLRVLGELVVASFGMTFDRSLILKILSQPGCEGMRFYLCKKTDPDSDSDFLSIVLVGVDQKGNDLLYKEDALKAMKEGSKDVIVKTKSLTGEYGHPPTTFKFRGDSRFSLLRIAAKRAENAWTSRNKEQSDKN